MVLFPLGLQARTRQFPIATILITLSTVIVSLPHFQSLHEYQKKYIQESKPVFAERRDLLLVACSQTDLEPEDCEAVTGAFQAKTKESLVVGMGRLQGYLSKNYPQKEARKRGERIAPYLAEDSKWQELVPKLEGSNFPELLSYKTAVAKFESTIVGLQKEHNLLSPANMTAQSLLLAEWTHGGWLHLIGNMVFFVLLAIPVEQRLGSLFFTLLYLVGGTFGLGAQILAYDNPQKILLGASANVFAIEGAFLVLFWGLNMRIWLSVVFIYNRVIVIPTWLFIPFFTLLGEFSGVVSTGPSGVAHLAHLAGCAAGAVMAYGFMKKRPLPKGYAFDFEFELMSRAENAQDPLKRLQALWELLFYNRHNLEAQKMAIDTTLTFESTEWNELPSAGKQVMSKHFEPVLAHHIHNADGVALSEFMLSVPESWPLTKIAARLNPPQVRKAAELLAKNEQYAPAVRLLELYCAIVPSERARNLVAPVIQDLRKRIEYERLAA